MNKIEDITKLDEKFKRDDLIYRYKDKTPDEKFNTYDNALNLINKMKNGEIKLAHVKHGQKIFKSNLSEIKKGSKKIKREKKCVIQY